MYVEGVGICLDYQFAVPFPAKALHQLFGAGIFKYAYLDREKQQIRVMVDIVVDTDLGVLRR